MSLIQKEGTPRALALILFVFLLIMAGCSKKDEPPPAAANGPGGSGGAVQTASGGEGILQSNGCGRCHALNGQGGRMGPDLSHAGADPQHTAQWIADHVKNPKTHNPGSRMPAFEGKINDQDLKTLSEYLAGLK